MKITYLIGNGFDINLGLKTGYKDFYKYYFEQKSKTDVIGKFKQDLNESFEKWSDLEFELGKYTTKFQNNEHGFISLLDDIQDSLADYLRTQQISFDLTNNMRTKIIKDIFEPSQYLNQRELNEFKKYISTQSHGEANLITFNYTQSLEKILKLECHIPISNGRINSIYHIHGTVDSNMILGVNDITQIENENFRESKKLRNHFVKPQMNFDAGTLRGAHSKKTINNADLICIYGMSLGATDKIWWQTINNRLAAKQHPTVLIIFAHENIPPRREYVSKTYKDDVVEKILSYSQFANEEKEEIKKRIFVSFNSNMFNIKPIKKQQTA